MSNTLFISVTLCTFLGLFSAASFFFAESSRATMQRLHQATRTSRRQGSGRTVRHRWDTTVAITALWLRSHFGLSETGGLADRMLRAGYRGSLPIDLYTASRVLGPLFAMLLAVFIPFARIFWMFALPAVAYILPDLFLEQVIRRRRESIRKSIPDAIDLLVICVDAGLGVDQAMMRVAQELVLTCPELHDELLRINREQRAGKPRLVAWQGMQERVKLAEIDSFVNMLMQTERFGTPIARALSTFATGIRLKRTQKAEECAAKTTIKIIFPLAIFIFPCLFIVLLGPAVITMLHSFPTSF